MTAASAHTRAWVFLAAGAGVLAGCAPRLPVYAHLSPAESLERMAGRAESVRTLSAECDLTLTDPDGQSVRLDGAIAAAFPDCLRIRAWKFGQAVFDLTLVRGRTWVLASDSLRSNGHPGWLAGTELDHLPRAIGLLGPQYFAAAVPDSDPGENDVLTVSGPGFDGGTVVCDIDRPTLTARRLSFSNTPGTPHAASLVLDRYRVVDGIAWPTHLEFAGPRGRIAIRLRGTRLNEPLPESAFIPPRRAVEQQ